MLTNLSFKFINCLRQSECQNTSTQKQQNDCFHLYFRFQNSESNCFSTNNLNLFIRNVQATFDTIKLKFSNYESNYSIYVEFYEI